MNRVVSSIMAACISSCSAVRPAAASLQETICTVFAGIAYNGAKDGQEMRSIVDGVSEAIIGADANTEMDMRMVSGAYLAGYASGLMAVEPAEAANRFIAGCMSEGV